jgi:hypothetical protein
MTYSLKVKSNDEYSTYALKVAELQKKLQYLYAQQS